MTTAAPADDAPPKPKPSTLRGNACRSARPRRRIFRPAKRIDQSVLEENRALIDDINRRNVLRGALSLGALTLLTGCDVSEDDSVQTVLRAVSAWNDRVQAVIFRPQPSGADLSAQSQVVKPPRFNAYYDIEDVKPVDGATWKLELAGRIDDKRPWTAQQIYELPEQEIIIRHICVEGWDYIGQWSGVNLRDFLRARRRRPHRQIRRISSAPTTTPRASTWRRRCIRRPSSPPNMPASDRRSVRLSAAAAHRDQARLQECEVDHGHRGDQRLPRDVLEQAGLQLVRGDLMDTSMKLFQELLQAKQKIQLLATSGGEDRSCQALTISKFLPKCARLRSAVLNRQSLLSTSSWMPRNLR